MLEPFAACWKGNGIERKLDENSSLESPATTTLPLINARCVIASIRAFGPFPPVVLATGASGRLTIECLILSRLSSVILPDPSTRRITAAASGPRPRETERYTFFEIGFTARSFTRI